MPSTRSSAADCIRRRSARNGRSRVDELLARIAGEELPVLYPDDDSLLPCDRETLAEAAADDARDAVDRAWVDAAGGKAPRLRQAQWDAYHAECDAAAERARAEVDAQWQEWLARARATVDALSGWPGSPAMPGLPGNPLPRPAEPGAPQPALTFPSTLSTVSTSSLARALAGPAAGFVPPANPPRPGARRTG